MNSLKRYGPAEKMVNVTAFVPFNGYLFLTGSSFLVDASMIKAINYRR
ncbi:MAG: hypothetical protein K6T88_07255 [Bacillus sp. (in: Bacteria)]|nr:hypothetical protein [Bacillus sp. (in: firmicutes)]